MGNVNRCFKSIGLGTILEAFYGKMTNQLIFFITFYIFHESDIKTSLI